MAKSTGTRIQPSPTPSEDWICQREVAHLFGISERTASVRAQAGQFRRYLHGVPGAGRKKVQP